MNPKKKPRQETINDPKGVKTVFSSENAEAKNWEKNNSESEDKFNSPVPEEEDHSHRKEKKSSDGSKKWNSDIVLNGSRCRDVKTPKGNGAALYVQDVLTLKINSIQSSAEFLTSGLEISSEFCKESDLKEVRRLLEEGRLDAERKSREAEQLKKALKHLFSNRSIWNIYLNC
jgi:hypothetical protein